MKKFALIALLTFIFSVSVFAQSADYSGEWLLNKAASKLPGKMSNIETITLTVIQSGNELKTASVSKRVSMPAAGEELVTYYLNGAENKAEYSANGAPIIVKSRARVESGRLSLQADRSIKTDAGSFSASTKETWQLSADGKTMTVRRETKTPQETLVSELIFTKKA